MKKPYKKELGIEELAAIKDEDIDFSDIPRLDERFWKNAKLVEPENGMFAGSSIATCEMGHLAPISRAMEANPMIVIVMLAVVMIPISVMPAFITVITPALVIMTFARCKTN